MTQLCKKEGIKCLCIQRTETEGRALVEALGLADDDTGVEEDTVDILEELSAVGKLPVMEVSEESSKTPTKRSTRSKGQQLKWSRALNSKNPIV